MPITLHDHALVPFRTYPGRTFTIDEVMEWVNLQRRQGVTRPALRGTLIRAADAGLLRRIAPGRYRLR